MSFQKPKSQQIKIPGITTSLNNGQSLVSTGNPSLDHILGGGIVIGSILLIGTFQPYP
jgi:elongator complex protein 4